jgi:Spy/CpxP family protein refolding chaperone
MTGTGLRLIVVAAAAFIAGLAGTVITRSQTETASASPDERSPLAVWLDLTPKEAELIRQHDPTFSEDLDRLRASLAAERNRLIDLFEAEDTSDEALRTQVENVIAAHDALERRVVEHLIQIREHLTPQQQRRLFSLCAENVRYCFRQQRWRYGQSRNSLARPGGRGPGGGPGAGMGGPGGGGRGYGRGRGSQPE